MSIKSPESSGPALSVSAFNRLVSEAHGGQLPHRQWNDSLGRPEDDQKFPRGIDAWLLRKREPGLLANFASCPSADVAASLGGAHGLHSLAYQATNGVDARLGDVADQGVQGAAAACGDAVGAVKHRAESFLTWIGKESQQVLVRLPYR